MSKPRLYGLGKNWDTSFTAKSLSAEDVADLKVKIPPSQPLPRLKQLREEAGLRLSTDPKFFQQESEAFLRRPTHPTPKLDPSAKPATDPSAFITAPPVPEDSLPVIGTVRPSRTRYSEKAYYGTGVLKENTRRKDAKSQSERRATPCKACEFRHEIEEAYFAALRPKTVQIGGNSVRTSQSLRSKVVPNDGVSAYLEAVSADQSVSSIQLSGDTEIIKKIQQ